MTSPEWEAANEDDSDRFPQTPHASDGVRWGTAALDAGAERRRAHLKHSAKGQSAEQMPWTAPFWLPVLVEEVGEVARAMCDRESAERVREELIQVAAMALAWADAIGHTLANAPAEGDGRG